MALSHFSFSKAQSIVIDGASAFEGDLPDCVHNFLSSQQQSVACRFNLGKGVAGVALIQALFLASVASCIDKFTEKTSLLHIPKWGVIVSFLSLCGVNHYVLVTRSNGVKFEREFTHLSTRAKVGLITSTFVMILAAIVFFLYSAFAYRAFRVPTQ